MRSAIILKAAAIGFTEYVAVEVEPCQDIEISENENEFGRDGCRLRLTKSKPTHAQRKARRKTQRKSRRGNA